MSKELELIEKVLEMQFEQREYRRLKRMYGNATTQLNKCIYLEKSLTKMCNDRRKEIEHEQKHMGKQKTLFA